MHKTVACDATFLHNNIMINIKLNQDAQCMVIVAGDETIVHHPQGTCFFDVVEYNEGVNEWQYVDEDMNSTFIPQNKCVVLTEQFRYTNNNE